jgi:Putative beta-barrel porin-2, OmpL-like. bbp2
MFRLVGRVAFGVAALAATLNAAHAGTTSTGAASAQAAPTQIASATMLPSAATAFPAEVATVTSTDTPSTPTLVAQIPAATGAPAAPAGPPPDCVGVSPYTNYKCLDAYLGEDIFGRMWNYYKLEWGQSGPPTDPNAPPSQIAGWPRIPGTVPPLAYTDWPAGAEETIGDTLPNGADSPFMVAIANTSLGQWMQANHLQLYGWINGGFNISSNQQQPGGNGPIGYTYTPNTAQLDQAVLYLDRWVDTVQTDHFDWGFRLSGLYGENYRYTNSYGIASYQFNGKNNIYGYDPVMEYADLYWPQPFNHLVEGLEIRIGRYISIPDIEAQLAPNNLTYTHSLTYTWDNYTNTGIVASWQVTPNLMIQTGITDGTETPIWHWGDTIPNLMPNNALYNGTRYNKDPGNQPSATFCVQYKWNNGWDTFYPCIDGINDGTWGYNNLQWHGFTYYHRFNDQWHNDFESYYLSERKVPNLNNPTALAIFNGGGTPFSPQNVPFNGPNLAYCNNNDLTCNVHSIGVLDYINYTPDPLNNFTWRTEWYDDPNGWRTGTGGRTEYFDIGLSWQHWFSPQIEIRPEITFWHSVGTAAFNGYGIDGVANNKKNTAEFASDLIFHF